MWRLGGGTSEGANKERGRRGLDVWMCGEGQGIKKVFPTAQQGGASRYGCVGEREERSRDGEGVAKGAGAGGRCVWAGENVSHAMALAPPEAVGGTEVCAAPGEGVARPGRVLGVNVAGRRGTGVNGASPAMPKKVWKTSGTSPGLSAIPPSSRS